MSSFLGGALGALAILVTLGAARALAWRRFGHRHGGQRLRWLARRIGARPDQEAVLRAEADALFAELHGLRSEVFGARGELADLLASPSADREAFDAILSKHGEKLVRARTRLADGLAKVHATLDATQRERLAATLRRGPHHGRHGFAH
jgi:uncharacterized membrane protein